MSFHSDQIHEIAAALAKAQGVLEGATKGKINPAFKSKYADLASVWDAAREPLSSNGLSVVQVTEETEAGLVLITMLMHTSGQWISSRYPVRPMKNDPQGYGSAVSYARRYCLMAIVGIAPEEDDGNAASARDDRNQSPPPRRPANQQAIEDVVKLDQEVATALAATKDLDALDELWRNYAGKIKAAKDADEVVYNRIVGRFSGRKNELLKAETPQAAE